MISSSRSFWKLRATGLCVTHRHTAIHEIYIYIYIKYYIYICIYIYMYVCVYYIHSSIVFIEGSLEVKLPTIWTDGKAEVGSVREEKRRRKKIREEKESEEIRCRCAKG